MDLVGNIIPNLHIAARGLPNMARNAVLAGVLSHLLVFIYGEWDIYAHLVALGFAIVHSALFLYLGVVEGLSWKASLGLVSLESASYGAGLFGSIVIYRAFFHRLRKFPGPRFAGLTAFWSFKEVLFHRFQWFRRVEQLHNTYGDFVRTSTCILLGFYCHVLTPLGKDPVKYPSIMWMRSRYCMGLSQNATKVRGIARHIQIVPCIQPVTGCFITEGEGFSIEASQTRVGWNALLGDIAMIMSFQLTV
jgi:hypothetical protein